MASESQYWGSSSIRPAAVAGKFYPAEPARLRLIVEAMMRDCEVSPAPQNVACIVAPHAGFLYSGPTAAHAYLRVTGKQPERIVLLGCSHYYRFDTASIWTGGEFLTPLGAFPIDREFASALARDADACERTDPHAPEHSLEVQLPFLSIAVGNVPIVPVLFGSGARDWHIAFGQTLAKLTGPDDLVVVSTDLSHYLSEREANRQDKISLDTLLSQDVATLVEGDVSGRCALCGATAVAVGMEYALARDVTRWSLLDYRTSAHASGDYERVVGYAAVTMERAA